MTGRATQPARLLLFVFFLSGLGSLGFAAVGYRLRVLGHHGLLVEDLGFDLKSVLLQAGFHLLAHPSLVLAFKM